jgi:flagellar basal body-associated protein FliL
MQPKPIDNEIKRQNKKNETKKIIVAILGTLFLLSGLGVGLILVRQNQQIKEKAATSVGTVRLFLSPETKTVNIDQTFSVNILLDTAGRSISALTIDISYPYEGDSPPITVSDIQINSQLVIDGNWNFPIKTINTENKMTQIRIAGLNSSTQGYKTTGEETVATITFKALSQGSINPSFNPTTTKATEKSTGEDILLVPSSTGNYISQESTTTETNSLTSAQTTNPSPTIVTKNSPSPTRESTPSPTPKISSTNKATPISIKSPSPSLMPVPESGFSTPTIIGIGVGVLMLVFSIISIYSW